MPRAGASVCVQSVFLVNVMVGASMFAVPLAVAHAGLVLGSLVIVCVAAASALASRYMLDAQGVVSAARLALSTEDCDPERVSFEPQASTIWAWLTPAWCRWVWLAPLIVYLVTDIAVFSVFIPSTAARVLTAPWVAPATLALLTAVMTPLAATTLRKTMCLQLALLVARHLALAGMLVAALGAFATSPAVLAPGALDIRCEAAQRHEPAPGPLPPGRPRSLLADASAVNCTVLDTWSPPGLPLIVSSATYALINQQYVPAIFAPVALPQRAAVGTAASRSVFLVAAYLLALAWTGVLAFDGRTALPAPSAPGPASGAAALGPGPIDPLYSLTFSFVEPGWLAAALMLAPAVALLSTYPLVAITLRDAYMTAWGLLCVRPSAVQACADEGSVDAPGGRLGRSPASAAAALAAAPTGSLSDGGSAASTSSEPLGAVTSRPGKAPSALALALGAEAESAHSSPRPADASFALRLAFAAAAVLPAVALALALDDFSVLVAVTGGFGGVFFMLIAPAVLIMRARDVRCRLARLVLAPADPGSTDHASAVRALATMIQVAGPSEVPPCARLACSRDQLGAGNGSSIRGACLQGAARLGSVAVASNEATADALEQRSVRLAELGAATAETAARWAAGTFDPAPWLVLALGVAVLVMTTVAML